MLNIRNSTRKDSKGFNEADFWYISLLQLYKPKKEAKMTPLPLNEVKNNLILNKKPTCMYVCMYVKKIFGGMLDR